MSYLTNMNRVSLLCKKCMEDNIFFFFLEDNIFDVLNKNIDSNYASKIQIVIH